MLKLLFAIPALTLLLGSCVTQPMPNDAPADEPEGNAITVSLKRWDIESDESATAHFTVRNDGDEDVYFFGYLPGHPLTYEEAVQEEYEWLTGAFICGNGLFEFPLVAGGELAFESWCSPIRPDFYMLLKPRLADGTPVEGVRSDAVMNPIFDPDHPLIRRRNDRLQPSNRTPHARDHSDDAGRTDY